jgi:sigma-B regulation protein RsbU (phosphoserine phosphatase)
MQKIAVAKGIIMSDYMATSRFFLVMQSHNNPNSPEHFISLAIYKAPDLFESFATPNMYNSYLISKSRFIAMRPKIVRKSDNRINITKFDFFNTIVTQVFPEGTTEIKTETGHPALVSFSEVGIGDMVVTAVIDKAAAFKAVDNLMSKSILFFISVVCVAVLISILASLNLTSAISKLLVATEQISDGNFNIDVNLNSTDEFGELARRFKAMAQKISSLLKSTAEQARMEQELEMVSVVQENLFPKSSLDAGPCKIVSYFEPASECGGDWFHYSLIEGRVFLWIGDATGHGAPAALITGAAKSAASIIEASPGLSSAQALEVLNHAIYSTAHSSILMTFFIGIIDIETGKLTYSNASHEFPYIVPQKANLKKRDLIPLCDTQLGKRLGQLVLQRGLLDQEPCHVRRFPRLFRYDLGVLFDRLESLVNDLFRLRIELFFIHNNLFC